MHPELTHTLCLAPDRLGSRKSEGSFILLEDERILFIYTNFSNTTHDDGEAWLASLSSDDDGGSWSESPAVAVANPPGMNIMSVSLLRLQDGRIGLWYLIKHSKQEWLVLMRTSENEAESWSEPTLCSPEKGLYVMNNDRVIQLTCGRLVLPVAWRSPSAGRDADEQVIGCLLSDDVGRSWRFSRKRQALSGVWLQEPGVVELKDGRVLLWCRTQVGSQYTAISADGGETWSELQPSSIHSPLSPASIKRLPGDGHLVMFWNSVEQPWQGWELLQRSPLHAAVSTDEGATWSNPIVVEEDPERWFCYTAIHFAADHLVLGYTAGAGRTHQRMATLQLATLPYRALPNPG